jgi:hypothetical protein
VPSIPSIPLPPKQEGIEGIEESSRVFCKQMRAVQRNSRLIHLSNKPQPSGLTSCAHWWSLRRRLGAGSSALSVHSARAYCKFWGGAVEGPELRDSRITSDTPRRLDKARAPYLQLSAPAARRRAAPP